GRRPRRAARTTRVRAGVTRQNRQTRINTTMTRELARRRPKIVSKDRAEPAQDRRFHTRGSPGLRSGEARIERELMDEREQRTEFHAKERMGQREWTTGRGYAQLGLLSMRAVAVVASRGLEKRKPWANSQLRARSCSVCSCVSTPSAVTRMPRVWARATMVRTISKFSRSTPILVTKERSIFSRSIGKRWR